MTTLITETEASIGRVLPPSIRYDPREELAELERYLGSSFDRSLLEQHERTVLEERAGVPTDDQFYRTSEAYLYDLTAFAMSGTKLPYLRDLTELVPPPAHLLDYGCGIGSDGLRLIEAGYRVSFADFDNPSTRYLRWRLDQRGIDATVYDLDAEAPPFDHDAVYCFDVIEHVPDPFAFLTRVEETADVVCVNFLSGDEPDNALHYRLPIMRLLAHATRRGLLRYRRYHGRSHLVLYRPRHRARPRSTAALLDGLMRAGVRSLGDRRSGASIR
jgi:2-polyprenyl-3-methyl-5-hydroxy-6-metoxy-1,4-benzoquinol methylase